jgi:hypothetical protein
MKKTIGMNFPSLNTMKKIDTNIMNDMMDPGLLDAFVVGGLLGDLHIQKTQARTQKCRLRFAHGWKQSEYCYWKYRTLEKLLKKMDWIEIVS